ncbi:Uncharacterized protein AXF42_Ash018652 [Apostasia shenzhenica]|uniref:Erythronate-4-phosphate dehydrogenase family protein n=1 Tax=Apostasia shenzhenica TaxID=1088818 RepID=A0A2I0B1J8_9ASPA|nr:Uncharacterized protein AXF42_Ash018652 [Apostasia shenzhenica]
MMMDPPTAVPEEALPAKPFHRLFGGGAVVSSPSSLFEIRLFYVRISPSAPDAVPPRLILSHLRREMGVSLEINGSRVPASELTSIPLRRDRIDRGAGEVTYVSTDGVRLSGALDFEVCDENGNLILCGSLERMEAPWSNGTICLNGHQGSSDKDRNTGWSMNCYSAASISSSSFVQPKLGITSPSIEVYVAGCSAGFPLILTQTIQLSPRKKLTRQGALDSIPEVEETAGSPERGEEVLFRRISSSSEGENDEYNHEVKAEDQNYYLENWSSEDDGQLSLFNAGVRVGVGIGLGMCVGVGIGVGLLMRSYQTISRSFTRRFF